MPKFILSYRHPHDYEGGTTADGGQRLVAVADDAMAPWAKYFQRIGSSVVDPGQPVFERMAVGDVGTSTKLGGYSVIEAADFSAAISLAQECPSVHAGGGVEIGLLADLPGDHPAAVLKDEVASRAS